MIPKLRAWSADHQVMLDVYSIFWYHDSRIFIKSETIVDGKHIDVQNFIGDKLTLMQSTGLKDKNGVEIFEGDIVKCCNFKNDFLSEYIGQVIFVDFGWHVVDHKDTYDPFYKYRDKFHDEVFEIEVIGNVWENPELLEVSHAQ